MIIINYVRFVSGDGSGDGSGEPQCGHCYRVAVVVRTGRDYRGECSGLILHPEANEPITHYPYVWDECRFEPVSEDEYHASREESAREDSAT